MKRLLKKAITTLSLAGAFAVGGNLYLVAADVGGEACWFDWEFNNRGYSSIGRVAGDLNTSGSGIAKGLHGGDRYYDYKDDSSLFTAAKCSFNDANYPTEWSAAVSGTPMALENVALITFGNKGGGFIGLVTGDPAKNEVRLVRTTKDEQYVTLASITVPNAFTAPHLYVIVKTARTVDLFVDGTLWASFAVGAGDGEINIGPGFQIGTVNGTPGASGIVVPTASATATNQFYEQGPLVQNSYLDVLRLYDRTLTDTEIEALADEFPYTSPNGIYTRTVAENGTWTSEDAWAKGGDETDLVDEPEAGSVVVVTAGADSTLTVGSDVTLETLEVKGGAALTLAVADGKTLVTKSQTVIGTDVTLVPGIDITGGPIKLAKGKTLTFDYSGYALPEGSLSGVIQLTGIALGSEQIKFIPPEALENFVVTTAFNETTKVWEASYELLPLVWKQAGETTWGADTLWLFGDTGVETPFIEGATIVFGDVEGAESVKIVAPEAKVARIVFNAMTTAYEITGGPITASAIVDTAAADVTVSATVNVENAPLTVTGTGAASFTDLRGSLGAVALAAPEVTLGTGGELRMANATTVSADTKLTIAGGDGTITYTAGSDTFAGSLEVTQGTFKVDCTFMNVKAAQDNPIKVTGTGTFTAVSAGNAGDNKRLPNNAYVEVDGKDAKFEVEGNNTLPRNDAAARIICKNGATLQANGADGGYDVHVNEIFLDSGHVYLAGTVANYKSGNNGPYAIRCDTDVAIHSSGDSSFDEEEGNPNQVGHGRTHGNPTTIEVLDGTLAFNVQLTGNLIKTGAGALKIGGVKGGSAKGVIDVQAGTLIASEQLVNTTVNKTITLANETALDISELTSTFDLATFQTNGGTLTTGEKLDLKTGSRVFKNNEKVISWNEAPACEFNHVDKVGKMYLEKRDDGLYAKVPGLIILVH